MENLHGIFVVKFGGSCIGSREDVATILKTVRLFSKAGRPILVVSAPKGVTRWLERIWLLASREGGTHKISTDENYRDELKKLREFVFSLLDPGASLPELSRLFDRLHALAHGQNRYKKWEFISMGERMSALIIEHYLRGHLPDWTYRTVDAADYIVTKGMNDSMRDKPDMEETRTRLRSLAFREGEVVIFPGYYGKTLKGVITLLDFNGSDITAALLGMLLSAARVFFLKDVNGLYTSNPKDAERTPELLRHLTYAEAKERIGPHSVIHAAVLEVIQGIPLEIRHYEHPRDEGTIIEG